MKNIGLSPQNSYDIIQEMIFSGKLKPGEVVTETSLSQRLGWSRTPIREALRQLEQEGLIVTEKRRKRINILSMRDIGEIFDLKIVIESTIAQWAAERGSNNKKEALGIALQHMLEIAHRRPSEDHEEKQWFDEYLKVDQEIHHLLFEMAENSKAEKIINNLNKQWHRLRVGLLAMEGRIEKSALEHQKFVRAILINDGEAASDSMKIHLSNLKRIIIKLMQHFFYPET
jgi:DNA-binding GntR family transcriptional regulator